jgi:hypothetical protein
MQLWPHSSAEENLVGYVCGPSATLLCMYSRTKTIAPICNLMDSISAEYAERRSVHAFDNFDDCTMENEESSPHLFFCSKIVSIRREMEAYRHRSSSRCVVITCLREPM